MTSLNVSLNSLSLNSTSQNCIADIFSSSAPSILLNIIRLSTIVLIIVWLILLIKMRELRRREMIFLNNINAIGAFDCLIAFYYLFYTSCFTLSDLECTIQSFISGYTTFLPNYALVSFALYRLYCATTKQLKNNLKTWKIVFSIALIWLLPAFLYYARTFFGMQLKSKYYPVYKSCAPDSSSPVIFFFNITTAVLIPNLSVLGVYLYLFFKSKTKVGPVTSERRLPRVTILVITYIIIFEVYCAVLVVAYYQAMLNVPNIPEWFFHFIRIFKRFNNFCPLGLFFTHTCMLKKYRNLFSNFKKLSKNPNTSTNPGRGTMSSTVL